MRVRLATTLFSLAVLVALALGVPAAASRRRRRLQDALALALAARPPHPQGRRLLRLPERLRERADASAPIVGPIDDPGMMQKAQAAFTRQAAAFGPFADIYAPYYRQADATYALRCPPAERSKLIGGVPAHDVIAAFDYYIKHLNHGRPFILAGHSQGSQALEFLLGRYMKDHPRVYKRMIVAYVVGYSVTPRYLAYHPYLKFTKGPRDTGVIVSWNTEAPTIAAPNPVVLPGGISVNPITWRRGQAEATAAREPRLHRARPGHRRDSGAEPGRQHQARQGPGRRQGRQSEGRRDLQQPSTPPSRPTSRPAASPWACSTPSTTRSTSSACAPTQETHPALLRAGAVGVRPAVSVRRAGAQLPAPGLSAAGTRASGWLSAAAACLLRPASSPRVRPWPASAARPATTATASCSACRPSA